MVVLHWGVVVVQQCQVVMGLDQEVVVDATVLVIVDYGREKGH